MHLSGFHIRKRAESKLPSYPRTRARRMTVALFVLCGCSIDTVGRSERHDDHPDAATVDHAPRRPTVVRIARPVADAGADAWVQPDTSVDDTELDAATPGTDSALPLALEPDAASPDLDAGQEPLESVECVHGDYVYRVKVYSNQPRGGTADYQSTSCAVGAATWSADHVPLPVVCEVAGVRFWTRYPPGTAGAWVWAKLDALDAPTAFEPDECVWVPRP